MKGVKRVDSTVDDWQDSNVLYAEDLYNCLTKSHEYITKKFYATQPVGTIVAWVKGMTGLPSLPTGWAECDGTNGTPNLSNRFLRGTTLQTGSTGGSDTHAHGFNLNSDGAQHGTASATGSTNAANHLPPYVEVVWIIKIT